MVGDLATGGPGKRAFAQLKTCERVRTWQKTDIEFWHQKKDK